MSKILSTFLILVVFIMGLSIGVYYSLTTREVPVKEEKKPIDSVQDIVIKNVQSESEVLIEETVSKEERVSPYAKMVIEKKFLKCGHTSTKVLDVPKELINLTEDEIKEKYEGWDIIDFSSNEFTLTRTIDANCEDHFVLLEEDGYIAVYNELTEDISNFVEKTKIEVSSLRAEDKLDLANGIKVYGQDELNSLIEDFES